MNFDFVLDRATLLPIQSHYICELPTAATETDTFKYTFENGVVTEYSLPQKCGIRSLKVTSREITIDASKVFTDIAFSINDGEKKNIDNWMSLEDGVLYTAYFDSYIAPEEIRTIEFFGFEPKIAVIPSETYTKEAIDILEGGEFGYTHSVTYPRIESDAAGAAALNDAIKTKYGKIIEQLKNGTEKNNLYNISYETSACDGVIFIRMVEKTAWQYSEGMSSQTIYYYDTVNDKELTVEEYLAHFGIDFEKATNGVLCSYDIAEHNFEMGGTHHSSEIGGEWIGGPSTDELYYLAYNSFDNTVKFDGCEVTDSEIHMYYNGTVYTRFTFKCSIERDTYIPVRANYAGYSMAADNPVSETIVLKFENGKVTEFTLPKDTGVYAISYSAAEIKVLSQKRLENCVLSINGEEPHGGSSEWYENDEYVYVFTVREYVPIEELKTIEIIIGE